MRFKIVNKPDKYYQSEQTNNDIADWSKLVKFTKQMILLTPKNKLFKI